MQRPSARDLLAHPFVAAAGAPTPGLMQLVGEYATRKRPIVPQRGPSPTEYSMVTAGKGLAGTEAASAL